MSNRPQLGLWSATAAVIASMVGAGIFTTTGFLARDLGHQGAILLVWLIGGIYAGLGARCYGQLALRFPESGGEYLFLTRTFNPDFGWIAGWISLFVGFSAPCALAASAFGHYLSPEITSIDSRILASFLIVCATLAHSIKVSVGNSLQVVLVLLKLLLIGGLIAIAFLWANSAAAMPTPGSITPPPQWPSIAAMGTSLLWVSFSYSGWNAAVYFAEDIKNKQRTLPRSLLLGTATVTVLYILLNAAFLKLSPLALLSSKAEVALIAAKNSNINYLPSYTIALVCLALATSVFAMTQLGPRVYAKMAEDGCAPKFLARRSGLQSVPRSAIFLQTTLSLFLLWSASFDAILTWAGICLSISTLLTVIGLIKVQGLSFSAIAFSCISTAMLVLAIQHRPTEALWSLLLLIVGVLARHRFK